MTKKQPGSDGAPLAAPPKYCTDNAAMVAGLGWHYLRKGMVDDLSWESKRGWITPRHPTLCSRLKKARGEGEGLRGRGRGARGEGARGEFRH